MKVYVVSSIFDGHSLKDLPAPAVVSVHSDKYAAESVRRVVGGPAKVFEIEMDSVPNGIKNDALQLFNVVL
jgi:hypothetical protein